MAGLDVDITGRPFTVLAGCSLIDGGEHDHCGGIGQPCLSKRGARQPLAQVSVLCRQQPVAVGPVVVHAGGQTLDTSGNQVQFQRVQRARGRGGTEPVPVRDALRRPQQLADVRERNRPVAVVTHRAALLQQGFKRVCARPVRFRQQRGCRWACHDTSRYETAQQHSHDEGAGGTQASGRVMHAWCSGCCCIRIQDPAVPL